MKLILIQLNFTGHCDRTGFIRAQEAQLVTVSVQEPVLVILTMKRNGMNENNLENK